MCVLFFSGLTVFVPHGVHCASVRRVFYMVGQSCAFNSEFHRVRTGFRAKLCSKVVVSPGSPRWEALPAPKVGAFAYISHIKLQGTKLRARRTPVSTLQYLARFCAQLEAQQSGGTWQISADFASLGPIFAGDVPKTPKKLITPRWLRGPSDQVKKIKK